MVLSQRPNKKTFVIGILFIYLFFFFFCFQAEDVIRYVAVTGVQTCALPIWVGLERRVAERGKVRMIHQIIYQLR